MISGDDFRMIIALLEFIYQTPALPAPHRGEAERLANLLKSQMK